MQLGRVGDEFDKPRGNLFYGQNLSGGIKFGRGLRHAIDRAAGRILGNSVVARRAEATQSLRTVPADAREQCSNDVAFPKARSAFKKHIDGWTVSTVVRLRNIRK